MSYHITSHHSVVYCIVIPQHKGTIAGNHHKKVLTCAIALQYSHIPTIPNAHDLVDLECSPSPISWMLRRRRHKCHLHGPKQGFEMHPGHLHSAISSDFQICNSSGTSTRTGMSYFYIFLRNRNRSFLATGCVHDVPVSNPSVSNRRSLMDRTSSLEPRGITRSMYLSFRQRNHRRNH